jgi:hypothetical protein
VEIGYPCYEGHEDEDEVEVVALTTAIASRRVRRSTCRSVNSRYEGE